MGYITHNFITGQKLTAADMRELDEQIALNESDIAILQEQVADIPTQRTSDIRQLAIVADGDAIHLYHGNILLSSVNMPDLENLIRCTGLNVSGVFTNFFVGETRQITAVRQPSDCNQTIRFRSSDLDVAVVSSTGLITALNDGLATITVSCGEYSQTIALQVGKRVDLINRMAKDTGWLAPIDTIIGNITHHTIKYTTDGSNPYFGNIPFVFNTYKLKPSETVKITALASTTFIQAVIIFKAEEGKTLYIADDREEHDAYYVVDVDTVDANVNVRLSNYTYTNTGEDDMYVAFMIYDTTITDETSDAYLEIINTKLSYEVTPAANN